LILAIKVFDQNLQTININKAGKINYITNILFKADLVSNSKLKVEIKPHVIISHNTNAIATDFKFNF
jgi:hypothetical protein